MALGDSAGPAGLGREPGTLSSIALHAGGVLAAGLLAGVVFVALVAAGCCGCGAGCAAACKLSARGPGRPPGDEVT